jgi:small subunit ribosomal protein S6
MANKYETIVVFRPELNDTQVKEEQKKIESVLAKAGAQEIAAESWGKKELAYLIKKCKNGTFVCIKYNSAVSDTVKDVTSILRITDSVIKFQTHVIPEKVRKFKGNPKRPQGVDMDDYLDSGDDAY